MTIVRAPRARISWMLETTLPCTVSRLRGAGTLTTPGVPRAITALGARSTPPAARGDGDHRRGALVDHGDGAVLELAGGEALGVDVGELLELERALQGDREADVPADEQDGVRVGQGPAQLADRLHARQHLLDRPRQPSPLGDGRGDRR